MEIFGELKELTNLRDYWKDEARDFTPWLSKNIELLADAVNLQITVEETESRSGKYRADILASEKRTGQKIIIENQLEDLDHKHIGQAITYAKVKEAEIIIWVVKHADDEQRTTIRKMNNDTDDNFGHFLCEIRLYSIDNSKPAVKFEVIEKPAEDWFKKFSKLESETKNNHSEYWTACQEYVFKNEMFAENFKRRKVTSGSTLDFGITDFPATGFISVLRDNNKNELHARLYIPNDKNFFHSFHDNKEAIEAVANLNFVWDEKPDRNVTTVGIAKEVSLDDKNAWQEQFDWLIDVMIKIKKSFTCYL